MIYTIIIVVPILFGTAATNVLWGDKVYLDKQSCLDAAAKARAEEVRKRNFQCYALRIAHQADGLDKSAEHVQSVDIQ